MCVPPQQLSTIRWERRLVDAVAEPDAAASNRKITRCHYELSLALRNAIGPEAGANFHTWAVWGSHKAGVTIRQEDIGRVGRVGGLIFGSVGFLVGLGAACCLAGRLTPVAVFALALLAGVGAAGAWQVVISRARLVAPRLILEGNRTVLEDIGAQTARFLNCLHTPDGRERERVQRFLAGMRSGRTADGGQDLLRQAFTFYYAVRRASGPGAKQRAAYLANCLAILHEHIRLQPYIEGAIPKLLRKWVTRWLLDYRVGPMRLRVGRDVAAPGAEPLRDELLSLGDPDLAEFISREGGCPGSAARDWTRLRERMRYVTGLFHALHLSPAVCASPLLA